MQFYSIFNAIGQSFFTFSYAKSRDSVSLSLFLESSVDQLGLLISSSSLKREKSFPAAYRSTRSHMFPRKQTILSRAYRRTR